MWLVVYLLMCGQKAGWCPLNHGLYRKKRASYGGLLHVLHITCLREVKPTKINHGQLSLYNHKESSPEKMKWSDRFINADCY